MPVKSDDKIYEERIKKFSRDISYRVNNFQKKYMKEAHGANKVQLRWLKEDLELLTATYQLYYNTKNKN
jgi:hypothetical protein